MVWLSKIHTVLLLFFICNSALYAQESRYIVYFTDKTGSNYSLDNPEEFLSLRSLERRSDAGILLDETDLPVSEAYLEQVRDLGIQPFYPSKWLNAILVQVSPDDLAQIEALSFVERAELAASDSRLIAGRKSSKFTEPIDSLINGKQLSWHGVPRIHENQNFGASRIIAVMDAGFPGVDTAEPFAHLLNDGRILMTENIVEGSKDVYKWHSHGTRVLSIIAGVSEGVYRGVSPGSSFMLFITEDAATENRIEEYNWAIAAEKADSAGADVINTSLGYTTFDDPAMDYSYQDMNGSTAMISRMAAMASEKGMVVVVSAGNSGNSAWKYISAPADTDNILSVGAVGTDSVKASFSSFGPSADGRIKPDVSSIGVGTIHLSPTGEVNAGNGTSFSAPIIAGFAALLWNEYPELTNLELMNLIRSSGHLSAAPNNEFGYGIPQVDIVLSLPDLITGQSVLLYPNPSGSYIRVLNGPSTGEFRIIDLSGKGIVQGVIERELEIDVSPLPSGIYILEMNAPSGVERSRFIKL